MPDLYKAAEAGDLTKVREALADPATDINKGDKPKTTPLIVAAAKGYLEIVKELIIRPGINVNAAVPGDITPLLLATQEGHEDIVAALLTHPDIDINLQSAPNLTPLIIAANKGYIGIMTLLMDDPRIDINKAGSDGMTPLHSAVKGGNIDAVRLLLSRPGILINAESKGNYTPLSVAIYFGRTDIIDALLAHPDIDVNKGAERKLPLRLAIEKNMRDVITALLARPDIDINKGTPIITALYQGDTETALLILQHPAIDINIHINMVDTPLTYAIMKGNTAVVAALLAKPGIDVREGNPLLIAVNQERLDIVKLLVAHQGLDVNQASSDGITPLQAATKEGNDEIVAALLDAPGINVNLRDSKGRTPLYVAAKGGYDAVVWELLEVPSIDVNIANAEGFTPLYIAASADYGNIVDMLLSVEGITLDDRTRAEMDDFSEPVQEMLRDKFREIIAASKPAPMWKGFTRSDASKFDTIFQTEAEEEGTRPPAENWSCCPVCLAYVERSEGCMYMKHNCTAAHRYYNKRLYDIYAVRGQIEWCTICGRITDSTHTHYVLSYSDVASTERVERPAESPAEHFLDDCRRVGGGGLPEKLMRFRRLREVARMLNTLTGEVTEKKALNSLVEATWNAPLEPLAPAVAKKLAQEKRWNIATEEFPPNVVTVEAPVEVAPNVVRPPANVEELRPILHEAGDDLITGDKGVRVIQFQHRGEDGIINRHEGAFIGVETFVDWLRNQVESEYGADAFGYCWFRSGGCTARLYPDEVKDIVPAELYEEYRAKFNRKFSRR
jgi:ankyrin repeat protein